MEVKGLTTVAVAGFLFPLIAISADSSDASGNWTLTVEDVASLQQDSMTTIKDEYAQQDLNPQLQFLCTRGNPAITAQIDWQRFISSFNIELGFKTEGGKFTWLKWKVDQSNKVTYSPSVDDSQKLIELALGGDKLLVEVTPYSGSPVTVEYDLVKFSAALAKLQESCTQ